MTSEAVAVTLTVGDGVFKGAYSFSSRFEEGEGTNPEELIAAAHAACFTMALANMMAEHGHPADSVRTVAKVHLRQTDAGPTIQQIDLDTEGRVRASTRSTSPSTPRRPRGLSGLPRPGGRGGGEPGGAPGRLSAPQRGK